MLPFCCLVPCRSWRWCLPGHYRIRQDKNANRILIVKLLSSPFIWGLWLSTINALEKNAEGGADDMCFAAWWRLMFPGIVHKIHIQAHGKQVLDCYIGMKGVRCSRSRTNWWWKQLVLIGTSEWLIVKRKKKMCLRGNNTKQCTRMKHKTIKDNSTRYKTKQYNKMQY